MLVGAVAATVVAVVSHDPLKAANSVHEYGIHYDPIAGDVAVADADADDESVDANYYPKSNSIRNYDSSHCKLSAAIAH